jgi:50S ribosomal protein L16 3-hydroxylase
MTTFNWLPLDQFLADDFEKRPRHIKNAVIQGYFGVSDLDAALTASMSSALPFSIGLHGRNPPKSEYTAEIFNPITGSMQTEMDPGKVNALLQRGATLRISKLARLSEKVRAVVTDIESWLGMPTSSNGYFSLGLQQGLPLHFDTHDVLAVQLMGRKSWRLYRPTIEWPVRQHSPLADKPKGLGPLQLEVMLEEGDALYLPRGWWHEVSPVRGEKTLHLAVGLYPPTHSDYLDWVLQRLLASKAAFRRSLPPGNDAGDINELISLLADAAKDPAMKQAFRAHYQSATRPISPFKLEP